MRGRVCETTNLKVMVVRRRMKESCRRFSGFVSSTEKVANVKLQMKSCMRRRMND